MVAWVKDLLISVLPSDQEGADALPWWLVGCSGGATGYHLTQFVTRGPLTCLGLSLVGPMGELETKDPASMALLLRSLKIQLKSALEAIDREERGSGTPKQKTSKQTQEVKAQLKKALGEVDREERTIDDSLRPHTLEQIENLEVKLDQAQRELKRLKSKLPKQ
jgi:hypothetical protein